VLLAWNYGRHFARPHYTIMLPDLDADLSRLLACENEIRVNPFFRAPEE